MNLSGITVIRSETLPANTMVVSPDVFDMLKGGTKPPHDPTAYGTIAEQRACETHKWVEGVFGDYCELCRKTRRPYEG